MNCGRAAVDLDPHRGSGDREPRHAEHGRPGEARRHVRCRDERQPLGDRRLHDAAADVQCRVADTDAVHHVAGRRRDALDGEIADEHLARHVEGGASAGDLDDRSGEIAGERNTRHGERHRDR